MQSLCNMSATGIQFTCSLSILKVILDFCAADCSCWPSKRDHYIYSFSAADAKLLLYTASRMQICYV